MAESATLTELLDPRDIQLRFDAGSMAEAISHLLRPALSRRLHDPGRVDAIVDAVIRRDEEAPAICGALALPHTRDAGVDDFVLSLGANPGGAIARHDPRLIVAFVSPLRDRDQHLKLLAALARLGQNRDAVERIAGASNPDQVVGALRDVGI